MKAYKHDCDYINDSLRKKGIEYLEIEHAGDSDLDKGYQDSTWGEIVDRFSSHEIRNSKNGSAFIPVAFKDPDDCVLSKPKDVTKEPTYRHDGNVLSVTMAVLDLDMPGARAMAEKIFEDYEYLLYSTHSYELSEVTGKAKEKFRIVLPLEEPCPAEEWPDRFRDLISGIDADQKCGNLSRLFYTPSHSKKALDEQKLSPEFKYHIGRCITLEDIKAIGKKYEGAIDRSRSGASLRAKNTLKGVVLKKRVRHFSGGYVEQEIKRSATAPVPSVGWNDYVLRHEKNIENLKHDTSHHNFALSAIASEVFKFRENTNIRATIAFLFKACDTYSNRPLDSGDTLLELPELFASAMIKSCPKEFSEKLKYFDPNSERNALGKFSQFIEDHCNELCQKRLQLRHEQMKSSDKTGLSIG